MLPIGNAVLLGSLLDNPGERSVVSVTHKWAQMMDDMVIQSARKPTDHGDFSRVVGCGGEDVIDPVVKFVAAQRKVGTVDAMRSLEYQGHAQTDDQMREPKRQADQQKRFPQQ